VFVYFILFFEIHNLKNSFNNYWISKNKNENKEDECVNGKVVKYNYKGDITCFTTTKKSQAHMIVQEKNHDHHGGWISNSNKHHSKSSY
jgi:ABC-type Fe3+/spermidine/putrescine transport system ATPase subunit